MDRLHVFFREKHIGVILGDMNVPTIFSFVYDKDATPISLSLPVNGEFSDMQARYFFENILPEGSVRQRLCRAAKVQHQNVFAMLSAYGEDCAGALVITNRDTFDKIDILEERDITQSLQTIFSENKSIYLIGKTRASLAGFQGKIAVTANIVKGMPQIKIPAGQQPTTHILKPASSSACNEYFCNRIAAYCGLNVPLMRLFAFGNREFLISERYDRTKGAHPKRIHQEDFCQALGRGPFEKYGVAGGIQYADMRTVLQHCSKNDLEQFISCVAFNMIIGNGDAHAKNYSILYLDEEIRLAPFYDLVSIEALSKTDYLFQDVDYSFAVPFGEALQLDGLQQTDFTVFASDIGASRAACVSIFQNMVRQTGNFDLDFEQGISSLPLTEDRQFRVRHTLAAILDTIAGNRNKLMYALPELEEVEGQGISCTP